jgi:DNA polymerase-1
MKKIVTLIDGSGFIFRAYHALPPFTRPDGTPVGAVFGFCSMLIKFLSDPELSKCVAVVFDAGRATFRNTIYPAYKANRPDAPEDLIPQFPLFREACHAFHLPVIEKIGFEADDIIATYTEQAKSHGCDVVIISADKDLMQLIDDHVSMIDPLKSKKIGRLEVFEKFGVTPDKVIEVQALIGDSSDNVPGVPSIGPKTAAELIGQFGSLEVLYENLDQVKQPKRRQTLEDNKDKAFVSKQLVTLDKNVPLERAIDSFIDSFEDHHYPLSPDAMASVAAFFKEQNFTTLINRLTNQQSGSTKNPPAKATYATITTADQLKEWIKDVTTYLAIDCETTSLNTQQAELVGIALAKGPEKACYVPVGHSGLLSSGQQMSMDDVRHVLKPLLDDQSVLKIGHNLKYDLAILEKYDLAFNTFDDTLVMSYVLDGGRHRHGLDFLAQHYFDHKMISYAEVTGTGKKQLNFSDVPLEQATSYAAEDADYTFRLYQLLRPRLMNDKVSALYFAVERPFVDVVRHMENWGICIDPKVLQGLGLEFKERADILEQEIYVLADHPFNIGSPKQLSEVLFGELGLPTPKKTKTGAFTTDADVLEDLANQGIPIAQKIMDWRSLMKLQSTYIDGLISAIDPKTKRVHTSYNLAGTTTGRLSSSDPNLQNIPIRTEDGRKIRSAFIASPGFKLVSFDYSQIELRLLAHMADIPSLKHAFCSNQDIHKLTASQILGIPMDKITSEQRRSAKAINFGIIYGISAYGLSQQLKISTTEAQGYINQYFKQYPGIQAYMERMKAFAREHGYVTTLMGRKCFTPGINDKAFNVRGFAERQAINAPLQGSNADIMKKVMIAIAKLLVPYGNDVRMLLQVHDELVFEIKDDLIDSINSKIQALMEHIVEFSVPLTVDVGVGQNWEET